MKELLKNSLEGRTLLKIPQNKPLDLASQQQLVRIIGASILSAHAEKKITTDIYSHWTNEIVQLFKEENRAVYLHTKLIKSGHGIANRLVGKLYPTRFTISNANTKSEESFPSDKDIVRPQHHHLIVHHHRQ